MEHTPSRFWVELDSQTQVLSRTRFLSRFGSPFIHISAPQGAGKSFLAQQLLDEQDAERVRTALLVGRQGQSDALVRSLLVHQLVDKAAYDDAMLLADFLPELARADRRDLLIIVDNAELLSESMLMELWHLAGSSKQPDNRRCSIILFAPAEALAEHIKALPVQAGVAPMTIDVPALSRTEALTLLKAALVRADRSAQEAETLLGTVLRPAAVLANAEKPAVPALDDEPLAVPVARRHDEPRTAWGMISLGVIVALAVAAGGWVWWSEHSAPVSSGFVAGDRAPSVSSDGDQNATDPAGTVTLPQVEGTALNPIPDVQERLGRGDVAPIQADEKFRLHEHSTVTQLPTPATAGTTTQASILPESSKRVVLPGNVVDALLVVEKGKSMAQSDSRNAETQSAASSVPTELLPVPTPSDVRAVVSDADKAKAAKNSAGTPHAPEVVAGHHTNTAVKKTSKPEASSTPKSTAARGTTRIRSHAVARVADKTTLEKISSQHYTIQLSGSHSLSDAWRLVEKSGLASSLTVYETRRNGKPWYVIISGNYANVSAAKQAIAALPVVLKKEQPWVKSYRLVQAELKLAQ
ncbi:AAA family ATPase [Plesiomonas sp.]|uniref:AAA family ATPase n=1 Tax=Plesiomonas sp. TaxID=2486279 RepID=UPI003F3D9CFE